MAMLRIPFLNNGVPLSFAKTRAFKTIFKGVPDEQHITSTFSFNIFSLYANSSTFNLRKQIYLNICVNLEICALINQ